ncbi:MAG TPA: exodeoxyribonuclease VII small subunit [Candidatus Ruania gallistercoris]|uniref:Exodeoxyribonuclease 7 small subunit n=1 Tax=Candidatus Ruania gallistercoris TaxID=2838746 RepID=A0A9D2EBJ0_9MICO|nr:exodeoxyribonuclease VII small subunit [Candidatus Ruania gallistercoris]
MSTVNSQAPDVATLSYEQARDELVDVVGKLESGAASLEDSLALWERGEALADRCQNWLDAARDRLAAAKGDSVVTEDENGTGADPESEPAP